MPKTILKIFSNFGTNIAFLKSVGMELAHT